MRQRQTMLLAALLAAPLSACGDGKEGTTIAIKATDTDGNFVAGVDGKTGRIAIDAPGFKGSIALPKIKLDASNFDMNGVHLYPGSTIGSMNVDANKGDDGQDGTVRVSFDSPADPATVRDWFRDKLNHAGFSVTADGNGLTGTTDEKKPFKLDLAPAGAGHAQGTITIAG